MTNISSLSIFATSSLLAVSLGIFAAPAAAADLTIVLRGQNLHAWSSMGECAAYYSGSECRQLQGVCSDTVFTSEQSAKELLRAVRDKGETVTIREMIGGLFPKGQFGEVWCTLRK